MAFPANPAEKIYTRDDLRALYELPENKDKMFELVNGVLIEVTPPKHIHSWIASSLIEILMIFVRAHRLGKVYADATGYDLPNGDTVMPDVSFVSEERLAPPQAEMDFAPDLAVEIVSPSNTTTDMRDKVHSYLTSGTKRVWVIYPEKRQIDVFVLHADGSIAYKTYGTADTLSGEDMLPGFTLPVADLFPKS